MTKKVSLKYKILCLRSVTSTIHTSHLEYMSNKWYCISYSGCNRDVPNFTIENEQQISRVSSYMDLVWTSFQYFQHGISLLQCIIDTKILLSNFFFFIFLTVLYSNNHNVQCTCTRFLFSLNISKQ